MVRWKEKSAIMNSPNVSRSSLNPWPAAPHHLQQVNRAWHAIYHQHDVIYHQHDVIYHQHDVIYHQHDVIYHQHDVIYHQHDVIYHQHDVIYHQHDVIYHQHDVITMPSNYLSSTWTVTLQPQSQAPPCTRGGSLGMRLASLVWARD